MAFHLRGTPLPDGSVRDRWTLGDRITFERPSQPAGPLADGGSPPPGLVDVRTRPGAPSEDEPAFDAEAFAARITEHRDAGTTALRFPGLLGEMPAGVREAPGSPRRVGAGRWPATGGAVEDARSRCRICGSSCATTPRTSPRRRAGVRVCRITMAVSAGGLPSAGPSPSGV